MNEDTSNTKANLDAPASQLPTPLPFHVTEPQLDRGLWCFWLTASDEVLKFVYNLNCILMPSFGGTPFGRRLSGRVMFAINPRYDHQEIWHWLQDILETEAANVELDDTWESAIQEAQLNTNGF